MFCPNCGNKMNDNAMFCGNCGWSKNEVNVNNVRTKKALLLQIVGGIIILVIAFVIKNALFDGNSFRKVKLITSYKDNANIDEIKTVTFGSYIQSDNIRSQKEPIEWIVLERKNGMALLLSKYILDCKCYENSDSSTNWESSSLREWLNKDFYNNAFSKIEQEKIQNTYVVNKSNPLFGTYGGNDTNDKVFCLSIDEMQQYFGGEEIKESVMYKLGDKAATRGTNYALNMNNGDDYLLISNENDLYEGNSPFWLRSPGDKRRSVHIVDYDGSIYLYGYYADNKNVGVRPAVWVNY